MFVHLLHLLTGEPPPPDVTRNAFVQEVRVYDTAAPGGRRMDLFILIAWILIGLKHALVVWACHHYPVPFHPLWINLPTWLLGVLATGIYYARKWRRR